MSTGPALPPSPPPARPFCTRWWTLLVLVSAPACRSPASEDDDPWRMLALDTAYLREMVPYRGEFWVHTGSGMRHAQGANFALVYASDGERLDGWGLTRGPDGDPWIRGSLRYDGSDWADPDTALGFIPADWHEHDGVVALLSAPEEDIHGCDGEDGETVACPPGNRYLVVWTTRGVESTEVPPSVSQVVADELGPTWAAGREVQDAHGARQALGSVVADLALSGSDVVAVTTSGEVWRGPVGEMVLEGDLGVELTDVEARGQNLVVVSASGQAYGHTGGDWFDVPSDGDWLQRTEFGDDGVTLFALGLRCVHRGSLAGLAPVTCQNDLEVRALEWSAGQLFTLGSDQATRWRQGLRAESWEVPFPAKGIVANDDEVQVVTGAGVFRLIPGDLEPVDLPGDVDLTAGPVTFAQGRGLVEADPLSWFQWDGGGWRSGVAQAPDLVPAVTSDGALWTPVSDGPTTGELVLQTHGGEPRVIWTGGRPTIELVLRDHVVLRANNRLLELFPDGQTRPIDDAPGELLLDPRAQQIWRRGLRWEDDDWVPVDLDLPGAPTGFAQDGTAWILEGDLWWARP